VGGNHKADQPKNGAHGHRAWTACCGAAVATRQTREDPLVPKDASALISIAVRVFGADIARQRDGSTESIFGTLYEDQHRPESGD
jgi:hypothetical protein